MVAAMDSASVMAGGEVGDDDDGAADHVLGLDVFADAGADLAGRARAVVDLELQELVGLGVELGGEDLGDAEVELGEVLDGDLGLGYRRRGGNGRGCGRSGGRGCWGV